MTTDYGNKFYAALHMYGVDTVSDDDLCIVFDSVAARDRWVIDNSSSAEAISEHKARAIYDFDCFYEFIDHDDKGNETAMYRSYRRH